DLLRRDLAARDLADLVLEEVDRPDRQARRDPEPADDRGAVAVRIQGAGRFPGLAQVATAASSRAESCPSATRSCVIESRWRSVTVPSSLVCPSTVRQNGVPASSMRR